MTSATHVLDVLPQRLLPIFEEVRKPLAPEGLSDRESREIESFLPQAIAAARTMAVILPVVARFGDEDGGFDAGLAAIADTWLQARQSPRMCIILGLRGGRDFLSAADELVKVALRLRREMPVRMTISAYPTDPRHSRDLLSAELAEVERRLGELRALAEPDPEDASDLERLQGHREEIQVRIAGG